MTDEEVLRKAKFYALRVVTARPQTSAKLKEKLQNRGYPEKIVVSVLEEFAKKGFLNDKKFSKLWIESRLSSNPKGAILLKKELKKKGVSDNTIEQVLKESRQGKDEYDTVKALADNRMRSLKGIEKTAAKRRLYGYLKRRGFDFETVMRVINEEFGKGDYTD